MKITSLVLATALAVSLALPSFAQTQIPAPAGWKTQTRDNGATTFTPPDLAAGEVYSVTLYPPAPLNGQTSDDFLRAFAGPVGAKAGQLAQPLQIVARANVMSAVGAYVSPNGQPLFALFLGVARDDGALGRFAHPDFTHGIVVALPTGKRRTQPRSG